MKHQIYDKLLKDNYTPLKIGERILASDIFIKGGGMFNATDTVTGVMSGSHDPHYRRRDV